MRHLPHVHHSFVPRVLANLFILLKPGLFSLHAGVSWFLQPRLYEARTSASTL